MVVGIDVGSHKVCCMAGEALPGGGLRVHGMGHAPASGIRRGEVIHVEDAAGAIASSVERTERLANQSIHRACIGLTGLHLESRNLGAVVAVGRRPREIEPEDVNRALESAGSAPLPLGREVLHVLPRAFVLDDGPPVVSPVGMEGYRLEAGVHLVTGSAASLGNVRRCLELAEIEPERLTFATLAAGEAVLTEDERELGVVVVDLGASATGVACYRDGAVAHTAVIPVGGRHMTNDLAVVFQTPLAQAERIKTTHGHVLPELDEDPSTEIHVVPFGEGQERKATRRQVSEVLAARADEIATLVAAELEEADLSGRCPAGVVLVGGGTELAGMPRRLAETWSLPVRIGRVTDVVGLAEAARGPGHAATVGLLLWSMRNIQDAATGLAGLEALERSASAWNWGTWLRAAFLPAKNGRN